MNLIDNIKISNAMTEASSGTGTSTGLALDMSGFEGCLFILHGTTIFGSTTTVKLRAKGATSTAGTWVFYEPIVSSTVCTAASFNYRIFALDMYKPLKRYIRPCITGQTSDLKIARTVTAIRYGARYPGSTNLYDSTTLAGITLAVGATSS